jgi:branched-chain amino acid transport system permease protein
LTLLPEALHAVKEYNVLVYGLILMGVLVFCPHGLLTGITGLMGKREKGVYAGGGEVKTLKAKPQIPSTRPASRGTK